MLCRTATALACALVAGAPAAALGVIEGVADAALSASKVAGGVVADRPGVERKALTAGGYVLTAAGHGAFGLATSWPVVAGARAVSWVAITRTTIVKT